MAPSTLDVHARAFRCRICGAAWRDNSGTRPEACPRCGARRVSALPVIGGAIEYALADRSQGYALEDIRFGKIAQWAGLITANQYSEALNRQRQYIGRAGHIPTLGEILVKQGALSRRQVEAVLLVRTHAWQDASEDLLCEVAAANGLLTREQILQVKQAQMAIAEKGETPPPLALLLYEKRLLTEKEVEALLQAQARRGRGLICLVQTQVSTRRSPLEVIFGASGTPARTAGIALGAVLVVALLLLVVSRWARPALYLQTQCERCKNISARPSTTRWPDKCSNCKERAVYPAAICLRCGHKFIVKKPGAPGVRCPACGYDRYKIPSNRKGEDEKSIRDQIKKPPPEARPAGK